LGYGGIGVNQRRRINYFIIAAQLLFLLSFIPPIPAFQNDVNPGGSWILSAIKWALFSPTATLKHDPACPAKPEGRRREP